MAIRSRWCGPILDDDEANRERASGFPATCCCPPKGGAPRVVSRLVMLHLLGDRRPGELLSQHTTQDAQRLLSLLRREGQPQLAQGNAGLRDCRIRARGGTVASAGPCMGLLLGPFP